MSAEMEAFPPTALYRYYDERNVLLYVGISDYLPVREMAHVRSSIWMQFAVRSTIERYPTRREALDAERTAIETEHPVFNKQYNDTPEAVERAQSYLADREGFEVDVIRPSYLGACALDAGATTEARFEVTGIQRVGTRGGVVLHVYDGTRCADARLAPALARSIADALTRSADHADQPALDEMDQSAVRTIFADFMRRYDPGAPAPRATRRGAP